MAKYKTVEVQKILKKIAKENKKELNDELWNQLLAAESIVKGFF